MVNKVFFMLMTLVLAISTYGQYEIGDKCYSLSRRKCQRTSACYYDKSYGWCLPTDEIIVVDCSGLSRRKCQRESDCYYDKNVQWCSSIYDTYEYDDETDRDNFEDDYREYDSYEYDDELYQDDYSDYDPDEYDYRA